MKIVYLLPPSEGKNAWWASWNEHLSFIFKKPLEIAVWASEKDLKCKGKRYDEWIELNKNMSEFGKIPAIERYSWVMYNAIDYVWMTQDWKKYFEENFIILSWMYWLVKPQDIISNYKLPIETKWLYAFWWDKITTTLNAWDYDYIVDLLPLSYRKMIRWDGIESKILRINFLHKKNGELTKITHGVKKVKWEYIKNICEKWFTDIPQANSSVSEINIISQ